MFKQASSYFDLRPASSATSSIRLGPPQPVKLGLRQLFIRQGPPLIIPERHMPLWFEKGWRRANGDKEYIGHYGATGRIWRGLILEPYPKGYMAYIWHPPKADIQRNTTHGPCFSPNGENGRYQVFFHSTPSSLDHVITSIEEVLTQALNGRAS
jgi:hypothetical protein